MAAIINKGSDGGPLLHRIPQSNDLLKIITIQRTSAELFYVVPSAFSKTQSNDHADRTTSSRFIDESSQIGDHVVVKRVLLYLGRDGQSCAFPCVDVADTLQPFRSSAYLIDFNLKMRIIGSKKAENDPLISCARRFAFPSHKIEVFK